MCVQPYYCSRKVVNLLRPHDSDHTVDIIHDVVLSGNFYYMAAQMLKYTQQEQQRQLSQLPC